MHFCVIQNTRKQWDLFSVWTNPSNNSSFCRASFSRMKTPDSVHWKKGTQVAALLYLLGDWTQLVRRHSKRWENPSCNPPVICCSICTKCFYIGPRLWCEDVRQAKITHTLSSEGKIKEFMPFWNWITFIYINIYFFFYCVLWIYCIKRDSKWLINEECLYRDVLWNLKVHRKIHNSIVCCHYSSLACQQTHQRPSTSTARSASG